MGCNEFRSLYDAIEVIEAREWILNSYLESYSTADAKGRKTIKSKMEKIAFPYYLKEPTELTSSEELERLFGHG